MSLAPQQIDLVFRARMLIPWKVPKVLEKENDPRHARRDQLSKLFLQCNDFIRQVLKLCNLRRPICTTVKICGPQTIEVSRTPTLGDAVKFSKYANFELTLQVVEAFVKLFDTRHPNRLNKSRLPPMSWYLSAHIV